MKHEPLLTTATIISKVVTDLLHQNNFSYSHFPELVDLAVVGTGLGMLQTQLSFVSKTGKFWDSTQWEIFPNPFLDCQALPYVCALAAWVRGDKDPNWANELPGEVKRPMRSSLKFLVKTKDSFFQPASSATLDRAQDEWWKLVSSKSVSNQVVALRHLNLESELSQSRESLIVDKLRSSNQVVLLHAISATERMKSAGQPVVDELRFLIENRDDEVRAKAMCSLARSANVTESAIDVAAKMLDSNAKFVVFAGVLGLSSLDSVPAHVLPPADRGFVRAMQICDYELIGLFAAAYDRWLDDPKSHFEKLLQEDSPEYLEIALEALSNAREQLVGLT